MYDASPEFVQALGNSHRFAVSVQRLSDNQIFEIIDGGVAATYSQQVARTAHVQISGAHYEAYAPSPLHDKFVISTGIPSIEMITLFTGRLDTVSNDNTQDLVTLQFTDVGDEIVGADFEVPWAVVDGQSTISVMIAMIQDVDSTIDVEIGPGVTDKDAVAGNYEKDRGGALDELAKSIGAIWLPNRFGSITIASNPYTGVAVDSGLTIVNGQNGTIRSAVNTVSRRQVTNSVTVVSAPLTGVDSIRVTVRDDDPLSPTYWGGPFGKRNCVVRNDQLSSTPAVTEYAERLLNQSLAMVRSWIITTPHFPLLDPLDVFTTDYDGDAQSQVVESISYPLLAVNETSISSRELADV